MYWQGKQAVFATNQEEDKFSDAWFPALSTAACFSSCFVYHDCILRVSTCNWFDLTTVITTPLTATDIIDFLCEKRLFVIYQICSFLFSAHFVDTMSKALEIPKWRLFNIRTEKGDEEGCLIVKFGIIGKGNSALPRQ